VAVVELVPASWRPYIGGSQTNSVWELIWGYNGLGRLTGDETGSVGGGGRGGGTWGGTGLGRLFNAEIGGQIAWLLPAALVLLVAGLVAVGRTPRTDVRRAALVTWGSWLVVTGLTFSLMAGIFHAYYTVALAPAVAALVGIGGGLLWQRRSAAGARIVLAATMAGTAGWAFLLLTRSGDFLPWLRWVVLVAGVLAALGLPVTHRGGRPVAAAVLALGVLAGVGGPAAYAVQTVGTAHTGSIVAAGPTGSGSVGGFGGGRAGMGGTVPGGAAPGGTAPGGTGGQAGQLAGGRPPAGGPGTATGQRGGGMGGLLGASEPSDEVVAALTQNASSFTWIAAGVGSNNAAGYQLATGDPVMAVGGFNGSDPSPTLEQFQAHVAAGAVHWFIGGGMGMSSDGGSSASAEISAWVAENFTARTVGGVTLYDLTESAG
jgi:4-amino-4-deoxy-L-arabinose transferase-like glycosyltransferase